MTPKHLLLALALLAAVYLHYRLLCDGAPTELTGDWHMRMDNDYLRRLNGHGRADWVEIKGRVS
jgi:hypothetical protein